MTSWYQAAYSEIAAQRKANNEMSMVEQRKYCSKNYPFGERKGWPYKAWCNAMSDHFGANKRKNKLQTELV